MVLSCRNKSPQSLKFCLGPETRSSGTGKAPVMIIVYGLFPGNPILTPPGKQGYDSNGMTMRPWS